MEKQSKLTFTVFDAKVGKLLMDTAYFSLEFSIALTLMAAAMWGSWMQIIKHLGLAIHIFVGSSFGYHCANIANTNSR